MKILLTITTTRGSDWRDKIKELKKLGEKEIAIFPTCLGKEERQELYKLLEKAGVESVPLVHIRNDMSPRELGYLVKRWGTKAFAHHSHAEWPAVYDYSKYRKIIFIENVFQPLSEKEIKNFGGICLDFGHLENDRVLNEKKFRHNIKLLKKYPIGCNHISAFKKEIWIDAFGCPNRHHHTLTNLSQLDYLKKYPKKYFSSLIAIELANPIKDQLKIRDYLIKELGRL